MNKETAAENALPIASGRDDFLQQEFQFGRLRYDKWNHEAGSLHPGAAGNSHEPVTFFASLYFEFIFPLDYSEDGAFFGTVKIAAKVMDEEFFRETIEFDL